MSNIICNIHVLLQHIHTHTHRDSIKDVSVTLVPLPAYEKTDNIIADTKKVSHAKTIHYERKNQKNVFLIK